MVNVKLKKIMNEGMECMVSYDHSENVFFGGRGVGCWVYPRFLYSIVSLFGGFMTVTK